MSLHTLWEYYYEDVGRFEHQRYIQFLIHGNLLLFCCYKVSKVIQVLASDAEK